MSLGSKIKDFFIGGSSKALGETAGKISDIVEKWHPGVEKKHEMTQEIRGFLEESTENARKHDQPMNSGIAWVDALVNGVNRLIRPWVTIEIVGSLFGYWDLPPPESIDPQYWSAGMIVLGFWFGGRFIVKDVPTMLKSLMRK